jgi:SAM-dependent methyltransferase
MPAEGEGRNAVFAASRGWKVHAFDYSRIALSKALELAVANKVDFEYQVLDCDDFEPMDSYYDAIAFSFLHLKEYQRKVFHEKLVASLKPGGILIAELFSKKQINLDTGGPKSLEMLYSSEELEGDFSGMNELKAEEVTTTLDEGPFHKGDAWVIQLYGVK